MRDETFNEQNCYFFPRIAKRPASKTKASVSGLWVSFRLRRL